MIKRPCKGEKNLLIYTRGGYILIGTPANNIKKLSRRDFMSVKVYSTPSCPWCTVAKNYLTSRNIPFEEIDVTRNREAAVEMIQKSGQRGVPVIDIDGTIIVGFDQGAIDSLTRS